MADTGARPTIRRRRIIERPRLIRALDRSQARVRMLVAPAGYGKTTLAEQWAARAGRRVSWVRSRRSSADVAVLARAMAAAGAEILPGCDRRLRERLNATVDPAEELSVLVGPVVRGSRRVAGQCVDGDRRLSPCRRVGDCRSIRRRRRSALAAADADLDARPAAVGLDTQRALRRGARDRPERAGDERGRGR